MKIRQEANSYCGHLSKLPAILVGTKLDLDHKRAVEFEEGMAIAKELNCSYIETSAAGDRGVIEAFIKAVNLVPDNSPVESLQECLCKLQIEKKARRSTMKSVKGFIKRCSSFSAKWRNSRDMERFARVVSE